MSKKSIESKSPRKPKPTKPEKPYQGFPLFSHPSGMWAKKIRGSLVYFTSWRIDPDGSLALEKFNREWPFLKDGKTPPPMDTGDGVDVRILCNKFVEVKQNLVLNDELSQRSFRDYYKTCKNVLDYFGKNRRVDDLRPDDFGGFRVALSKRFGVNSLKNEINRVRILFKFGHDQRLIENPINYGQSFNRPSAKVLRKDRNEVGAKLFEREEVLAILESADPVMKAMFLLAVNCGFGNTDVASLPEKSVDLELGWIEFPRPKTGIERRCPLWPETISALEEALTKRPNPADDSGKGLCFLTRFGLPWVRITPKKETDPEDTGPEIRVPIDSISGEFAKILRKLKINGRRGLGFYTGRHTFETIGGESKDQVAVNGIMGHVDSSMAGVYRHRISDERLIAVTNVIREWLFGTEGGET